MGSTLEILVYGSLLHARNTMCYLLIIYPLINNVKPVDKLK